MLLVLLIFIAGIFSTILFLHRKYQTVEDLSGNKYHSDTKEELPYSDKVIKWELKLDELTDDMRFFEQIEDVAEMMRQYYELEYQQVRNALMNREILEIPNVSKENVFSSSRFLGRLIGFNVAALDSPRKLCLYNRSYHSECKTKVIFSNAFDYKEEKAVEILMKKIMSMYKENYYTEEYRLGLWEGTAILLHKEDLSLLYTEINVDFNKHKM